MAIPVLPLGDMSSRHIGLTQAIAESYLEAARVTLDRHHTSPQQFTLQEGFPDATEKIIILLQWESPDARCRSAWANTDDATANGAYACAIAAIELRFGLYAIRRAETRTGSDYYVAPIGHNGEDLEDCYRLEVSGTNLDEYEVKQRLRQKIRQVRQGKSNLPAIAIVVGFKVKLISLQPVEL